MKKLMYILLIVIGYGCVGNQSTEKKQANRNEIVNVKDKIMSIDTDVLIGNIAVPRIINDYLIVADIKSIDKLIHIFDKNNFNYIKSIASRGQGPGEIANIGYIGIDNKECDFYVTDHGRHSILKYNIDSVLFDSNYIPSTRIKIQERLFPEWYQYINDSLSLSLIINPIGNSGYNHSTAVFNMNNGDVLPMKYEHPDIEKKRICLGLSVQDSIYVECHLFNDLMSICDLKGNLKYNIYGPKWNNKMSNKIIYYDNVVICNNKIIATYSGEDNFNKGKDNKMTANYPTKFLVFDIKGDYVKTLETDCMIHYFCYDKEKNRIIMTLNNEIQFAYLDLNGII